MTLRHLAIHGFHFFEDVAHCIRQLVQLERNLILALLDVRLVSGLIQFIVYRCVYRFGQFGIKYLSVLYDGLVSAYDLFGVRARKAS